MAASMHPILATRPVASEARAGARAVAGERARGLDVARAFAILGMILVNMKGQLMVGDPEEGLLATMADWTEGKAAALFVVLAGVGVSLRAKRARAEEGRARRERLAEVRGDLVRRAVALFVLGMLHVELWEWDILHFYGLYIFAAAWLVGRSNAALLAAGLSASGFAVALHAQAPAEIAVIPRFDPGGLVDDLFWHGLHPFFPWFAFIAWGMWIGRLRLKEVEVRSRLFRIGMVAWCAGETLAAVTEHTTWFDHPMWSEQVWGLELFNPWPRPGSPVFVLVAGGLAAVIIALCLEVEARGFEGPWGPALVATGQLALTCYVAHGFIILLCLQHGVLSEPTLGEVWGWGLTMFAAFVLASWWWRRRHLHGPLEVLLRMLSSRTAPAGGSMADLAGDR